MGVVLVVVSVLIAIALIVAVVVTARRLAAQRASTAAAEARATEQAAELATVNAALEQASREKAAAEERAVAAEEATTLTAEQAELALQQARHESDAAAEGRQAAEDRAAAAERRAVELVELVEGRPIVAGLDADVVWSLEQARSERAWRLAIAPGPDAEPVFTGTGDPLLEALQVELDAAREEVGAIVELEAELSAELTAAASVLALPRRAGAAGRRRTEGRGDHVARVDRWRRPRRRHPGGR